MRQRIVLQVDDATLFDSDWRADVQATCDIETKVDYPDPVETWGGQKIRAATPRMEAIFVRVRTGMYLPVSSANPYSYQEYFSPGGMLRDPFADQRSSKLKAEAAQQRRERKEREVAEAKRQEIARLEAKKADLQKRIDAQRDRPHTVRQIDLDWDDA